MSQTKIFTEQFYFSISGFDTFLGKYLELWRMHHQYWMTEYKGKLKIILYDELVADVNNFLSIVSFFGYDSQASKER